MIDDLVKKGLSTKGLVFDIIGGKVGPIPPVEPIYWVTLDGDKMIDDDDNFLVSTDPI